MKTVQKLTGHSMSDSHAPSNLPIPVMQPTEHHIDEDAKSRMDDEGGSQEPTAVPPVAAPPTAPPATVEQADGC